MEPLASAGAEVPPHGNMVEERRQGFALCRSSLPAWMHSSWHVSMGALNDTLGYLYVIVLIPVVGVNKGML